MHGRQIRVIKRGQPDADAARPEQVEPRRTRAAERELKEVVSGWVREHQHRAEEFQRNYSTLLAGLGLRSPGTTAFVAANASQK